MRIRFHTAEDVFTAFPTLADDVLAPPTPDAPLVFFARLFESPTPEDAIAFFAYLAPKREAVWWSCRCVRRLDPERGADTLIAAERWVAEPEEEHRLAALKLANAGEAAFPATWAAYGAGWSGGNIGAGNSTVAILAAPHLTAKAVRAAVLVSVSCAPAAQRASRLRIAYDEAAAVATSDVDAAFG